MVPIPTRPRDRMPYRTAIWAVPCPGCIIVFRCLKGGQQLREALLWQPSLIEQQAD